MTPEEARDLLKGTTPGPWGYYSPRGKDGHYDPVFGDVPGDEIALVKRPADWHLIAAAPALAAMIAGMRVEWSRQALISGDPEWHPIRWCRSREEAERTYWTRSLPSGATVEYRLVPRYIIEPETTNGRKHEH